VSPQIFTHFIREEDPGMTSGRLDGELRRMSIIADQIGPQSLMLFNESFAGTSEREGPSAGGSAAGSTKPGRPRRAIVSVATSDEPFHGGDEVLAPHRGWAGAV
jgi:hypothetical protein